MDKQILLIASKLLDQASDQFSNHGCNDLGKEVLEVISNEEELARGLKEYLGEDEILEKVKGIPDWLLMEYISYKLEEEAKK